MIYSFLKNVLSNIEVSRKLRVVKKAEKSILKISEFRLPLRDEFRVGRIKRYVSMETYGFYCVIYSGASLLKMNKYCTDFAWKAFHVDEFKNLRIKELEDCPWYINFYIDMAGSCEEFNSKYFNDSYCGHMLEPISKELAYLEFKLEIDKIRDDGAYRVLPYSTWKTFNVYLQNLINTL